MYKGIALALNWIIQSLLVTYSSYQIGLVYYGADKNLYKDWSHYLRPVIDYEEIKYESRSWFARREHIVKSKDKSEDPKNLFIQSSILLITFVHLIVMIIKMITCSSKNKTSVSHIIPPKIFDNRINIVSWLAQFELYFESQNIQDNQLMCHALLSRLDTKDVDMVKCYLMHRTPSLFSIEVYRYDELKQALLKLFGEDKKNETEAQAMFVNRAQHKNENIHRYFASLNGLCQNAFTNLNSRDQERLVINRFINGLTSDSLRQRLLSEYDSNHLKRVIILADRFAQICNSKQIEDTINVICSDNNAACESYDPNTPLVLSPTTYEKNKALAIASHKGDRLCNHCGLPIHNESECPLKYEPNFHYVTDQTKSCVGSVLDDISKLREVKGVCRIDEVPCQYLFDTGASKTVIHQNMVLGDRMKDIQPYKSMVFTADGSCANILGTLKVKLGSHVRCCIGCARLVYWLSYGYGCTNYSPRYKGCNSSSI